MDIKKGYTPTAERAEGIGEEKQAPARGNEYNLEPKNQQEQPPVLAQQNTAQEQYDRKSNLFKTRIAPGTGRYAESVFPGKESAPPADIAKDQRIEIVGVEELTARPQAVRTPLARKLYCRMPPVQKDRSTLAAAAPVAKPKAEPQPAESHQSKRVLPDLPVPYRIGVGQQWERNARGTSIWSEVLLGRHWSVRTYFVARDDARSYMPHKQSLGARFRILYVFGKAP